MTQPPEPRTKENFEQFRWLGGERPEWWRQIFCLWQFTLDEGGGFVTGDLRQAEEKLWWRGDWEDREHLLRVLYLGVPLPPDPTAVTLDVAPLPEHLAELGVTVTLTTVFQVVPAEMQRLRKLLSDRDRLVREVDELQARVRHTTVAAMAGMVDEFEESTTLWPAFRRFTMTPKALLAWATTERAPGVQRVLRAVINEHKEQDEGDSVEKEREKREREALADWRKLLATPGFTPETETQRQAQELLQKLGSGQTPAWVKARVEHQLETMILDRLVPEILGNEPTERPRVQPDPAITDENTVVAEKMVEGLRELDPHLSAQLIIRRGSLGSYLTGTVTSSHPQVMAALQVFAAEFIPDLQLPLLLTNLAHKGIHVVVEQQRSRSAADSGDGQDRSLDRVRVLFQGSMPMDLIQSNPRYKQVNDRTYKKLSLCFGVLGFAPPLVLDRNLQVIDGNLRLKVMKYYAQREGRADVSVPVVVIDDAGVRADFLRLALNRLSEFQRWVYPEVDEYVDSVPQAQPLLEPLGFFGERMLPASYFGDTMVNYSIDQYSTQQQQYKQEIGLAEWAKIQRRRIRGEEEYKAREPAVPSNGEYVSLFDLTPAPEDFLPTHDAEAEMAKIVREMQELGEVITTNYDAHVRGKKQASVASMK